MPEAYEQLEAVRAMLEVHYREMQDLEFTIERGKAVHAAVPRGETVAAGGVQNRGGSGNQRASYKGKVERTFEEGLSAKEVRRPSPHSR